MMQLFQKYAAGGSVGWMLDVGANAGYFGLLAAKYGHKVLLFDLQPECQAIVHNSILVNGFAGHAHVIAAGVSDIESEIKVPSEGCNGRFPAEAYERKSFSQYTTTAQLYPLSSFVSDIEIMMLKVDTEGNEKRVLKGAIDFFQRKKIRNAIVEITPGYNFWNNTGITKDEVIDVLTNIMDEGYIAISLDDWTVLRNRSSIEENRLIKSMQGQFDIWITLEPAVLEAVGNRTVVDASIATAL